jgi:nitroreductase
MATLQLTADEVLATTRAVRRRLDLTRPVEQEVLEECLTLAQQAPRASNVERRAFVVVRDAAKRAALADLWRQGMEAYLRRVPEPEPGSQPARMLAGVRYLGEHMQDVPVHLIPCALDRLDGKSLGAQAGLWGSIGPAIWSFMLAARARGLGTCWTTFHLAHEEAAAEILGIPYAEVSQVALIPVAYTTGTVFKPAPREPLDAIAHWDSW